MKRLFIVRHARSKGNDARVYEGWLGGELTRLGVKQARCLGKYFSNIPLDSVYCSDLNRARQTLEEMRLGLKTRFCKELRERNYGDFNGKDYSSLSRMPEHPDLFHDFYFNIRVKPSGGESILDVRKRVLSFFKKLDKEKTENALIITHHNPAMLLLDEVAGTPLSNWRVFVQSNACINSLVKEGKKWRISRVNDTSHLHY
ncbi:MAG: histidine phosphatase family protein [Candidatus Micrarchaeota archaeon]